MRMYLCLCAGLLEPASNTPRFHAYDDALNDAGIPEALFPVVRDLPPQIGTILTDHGNTGLSVEFLVEAIYESLCENPDCMVRVQIRTIEIAPNDFIRYLRNKWFLKEDRQKVIDWAEHKTSDITHG